MNQATLGTVATVVGVVGGIAGIVSILWTVLWSVTLRPRARWSLNRFDTHPVDPSHAAMFPDAPPMLRFYFRNVGTAAADDAHIILVEPNEARPSEFPLDGRQRIEPGGEIIVLVVAAFRKGSANRPYKAGDDSVFELRGVKVKIRWRRQLFGFATRRFDLDKKQFEVPFT
jgi:hypothetical protein